MTEAAPEQLTPREAAACLVFMLYRKGATFTFNDQGYLDVNIDAVQFPFGNLEPEQLIALIHVLMAEIKTIAGDRQVH